MPYVCPLCNLFVPYAICLFRMPYVCPLCNLFVPYAIRLSLMQFVCSLCPCLYLLNVFLYRLWRRRCRRRSCWVPLLWNHNQQQPHWSQVCLCVVWSVCLIALTHAFVLSVYLMCMYALYERAGNLTMQMEPSKIGTGMAGVREVVQLRKRYWRGLSQDWTGCAALSVPRTVCLSCIHTHVHRRGRGRCGRRGAGREKMKPILFSVMCPYVCPYLFPYLFPWVEEDDAEQEQKKKCVKVACGRFKIALVLAANRYIRILVRSHSRMFPACVKLATNL